MPKTANKPVIAVDIDDVLSASAESFVAFSNKMWGTNLAVDDYDEHWARMWQVDDDEAEKRAELAHDAGFFGNGRHFADAKPILEELSKNYKLVIATSRNKTLQGTTLKWLDKNFPNIFSEIHFSGLWDDKNSDLDTMANATKANLCKQIGADYLIDDQPKHCLGAAEQGVKCLLFGDYGWSRDVAIPEGVTRARDWQEVLEYFERERS